MQNYVCDVTIEPWQNHENHIVGSSHMHDFVLLHRSARCKKGPSHTWFCMLGSPFSQVVEKIGKPGDEPSTRRIELLNWRHFYLLILSQIVPLRGVLLLLGIAQSTSRPAIVLLYLMKVSQVLSLDYNWRSCLESKHACSVNHTFGINREDLALFISGIKCVDCRHQGL